MTTQPEETPTRHYEVSIVAHPEATSPTEAYLMTVDSLIRFGTDQFHPLIIDVDSGERFMLTADGKMITGEAVQAALEQLEADMAAADDDSADRG